LTTSGWTILHVACANGKLDIVKLMVQRGAHLQPIDRKEWTPMMWALDRRYFQVAAYLFSEIKSEHLTENEIEMLQFTIQRYENEFLKHMSWFERRGFLFIVTTVKQTSKSDQTPQELDGAKNSEANEGENEEENASTEKKDEENTEAQEEAETGIEESSEPLPFSLDVLAKLDKALVQEISQFL